MTVTQLAPLHPGEVLLEEFIRPMALTQKQLGMDLGVNPRRINELVRGKRRVTPEMALRLARYFGTSVQFWVGLQADYDVDTAQEEWADKIAVEVKENPIARALAG